MKNIIETKFNDEIKKFEDFLPSGSGIDYPYDITERKNGNIFVKGHFHAMNNNGYYDGIMSFSFIVYPNGEISDIKCNENKKRSFYGLKDYLNDLFYSHFKEIKIS